MKQKKIVLNVFDSEGKLIFQQNPSSPDAVFAALQLFAEVGNKITIDIAEIELSAVPSNQSLA